MRRSYLSVRSVLILALGIFMVGCGQSEGFETVSGGDSKTRLGDEPVVDPLVIVTEETETTASIDPDGTQVTGQEICPECALDGLQLAEESFTQPVQQTRELDILLVVDNSGSMAEEQAKLSNLSPLLDFIKDVNWRVAIASTNASENYFRETLDSLDVTRTFAEKKQRFSDVILSLGTSGTGNEQGITQTYNSVVRNHPNGSGRWVRNDSFLSVIVVSDEDECSNGANCGATNAQLLDRVENTVGKERATDFRFSSLIKPDSATCPQAAYVGNRYKAMSDATSGLVSPICDNSYEDFLESIAANLAIEIEHGFHLAHDAAKILSIEVNGQVFAGTHIYKNQVLVLDPLPQGGDQVVVNYAHP